VLALLYQLLLSQYEPLLAHMAYSGMNGLDMDGRQLYGR